MSPHVATARLEDLPRVPSDDSDEVWTPIRHLLGVQAFGINAWHGDAEGDPVIEDHDELPSDGDGNGQEELYLVVSGHARFVVDGDEVDAPAGTIVVVPPNLRRSARAAVGGTTVVVVGAARGEAFTPSAWERRAVERAGLA